MSEIKAIVQINGAQTHTQSEAADGVRRRRGRMIEQKREDKLSMKERLKMDKRMTEERRPNDEKQTQGSGFLGIEEENGLS